MTAQFDVDNQLLEKCKSLIEEKLQWGSSAIWTSQDFELLSERIEAETKINLSAATLKRIWGRVRYTSKPTVTTLDTLTQFIGYQSWRDFKLKHDVTGVTLPVNHEPEEAPFTSATNDAENQSKVNSSHRMPARFWFVASFLTGAVVIITAFVFFGVEEKEAPAVNATDEYTFSSRKIVSEGVPNSVIFEYDASNAGESDTIFIQQSWDTRLRDRVSRNEHIHKSIYYYPGFFRAKLVVNNKIVKEHNIYIQSEDWLPVIERPTVPVYLEKEDVVSNGKLSIPTEAITAKGISLQPETPWVSFHLARTFGALQSDNFIFETEVKNEYGEGTAICQLTEIHIRLEGGMIMIPLSIKGCVSNLSLFDMDGKRLDTSELGCDFSDWVNMRCEVRDRKGQLFINGRKVYDLNLNFNPVKIVGLLYRFQGTGSVNFARLSDVNGKII